LCLADSHRLVVFISKNIVEPALQARRLYAEGEKDDDASERFRVGPYVEWDIWRGRRADVELDRGPCKMVLMTCRRRPDSFYTGPDALSSVRSTIIIQQAWLKQFARVQPTNETITRSTLPESHTHLLDQFIVVLPHVLPPDSRFFPVLWHTDLYASNIMVESKGKPNVTSIIDWQGMRVVPLFMQCVHLHQ
jgi:hypothetical protein